MKMGSNIDAKTGNANTKVDEIRQMFSTLWKTVNAFLIAEKSVKIYYRYNRLFVKSL